MDLKPGARNVIVNCLGVRPQESTLILSDTFSSEMGRALFRAAREANARAVYVEMMPHAEHNEEPVEPVAKIMSRFDVVVAAAKYSLTHTRARVSANRAGARMASITGVTPVSMAKGGLTADYFRVMKHIHAIYRKVRFKTKLRVESDLGTNVTFRVSTGRWILDDNGICHHRGMLTTLPAGEIFVSPIEGRGEGSLVIDRMLGAPISRPIEVEVKEGRGVRFSRATRVVKELTSHGDEGRNIAEFGIGLNPKSLPEESILEAEKALGTVHVGFGDSSRYGGKVYCKVHHKGIMSEVDVYAGTLKIMEKGRLLI